MVGTSITGTVGGGGGGEVVGPGARLEVGTWAGLGVGGGTKQ